MTKQDGELEKEIAETEKPVEKQKRRGAVLVYETLREDILWLNIAPGTAIDEVALAQRFSVSRTPIREALLLLQGDWLVHFLPNRTSIVAPLSLNNAAQYFDSHLMLARMAAHSAARSGRAKRPELMARVAAFRKAIEVQDHRAALRASLALQRDLTGLSDNIFLERYFGHSLDSGIRTKIVYYFPNATRSQLYQASDKHEALIDAVVSCDADASDQVMRDLVGQEIDIVLQSLQPTYGASMEITSVGSGL